MNAHAKAFWLPKDGSNEAEYEDAFFPYREREFALSRTPRFAISDGATEASFSRLWARLLVTSFVRGKLELPLQLEQLEKPQQCWAKKVHTRKLPWYGEEKIGSGAFASLLGIEFKAKNGANPGGLWSAASVGDSCLVQVRENRIEHSFPLATAASFTSRPELLSSLPEFNRAESDFISSAEGTWHCGDHFFLMTDALACWFLKNHEQGNRPWILLMNLNNAETQTTFPEFVSELRSNNEIKNDDVTLLSVNITE